MDTSWIDRALAPYAHLGKWTVSQELTDEGPALRLAFESHGARREGQLPAIFQVGPEEERIGFTRSLAESILGDLTR